jgi:hypothetical protein
MDTFKAWVMLEYKSLHHTFVPYLLRNFIWLCGHIFRCNRVDLIWPSTLKKAVISHYITIWGWWSQVGQSWSLVVCCYFWGCGCSYLSCIICSSSSHADIQSFWLLKPAQKYCSKRIISKLRCNFLSIAIENNLCGDKAIQHYIGTLFVILRHWSNRTVNQLQQLDMRTPLHEKQFFTSQYQEIKYPISDIWRSIFNNLDSFGHPDHANHSQNQPISKRLRIAQQLTTAAQLM